jgi:hypothetical protein
LWLQLDENQHSSLNNADYQTSNPLPKQTTTTVLDKMEESQKDNGLGINITKLTDAAGKKLLYVLNKTMLRLDLPTPLKPGQKFVFNVDWNYKITDRLIKEDAADTSFFRKTGIIYLL